MVLMAAIVMTAAILVTILTTIFPPVFAAIFATVLAAVFSAVFATILAARGLVGLSGHGNRRQQCAGHEQSTKQL